LYLLYNILTYIAAFHIKLIAFFNTKLKLGVDGRAQTFNSLEQSISKNDQTIWLHCASLGEYEQGLPVFQELRTDYPNHKIILSFFSPSGFEIRNNSPIADVVVYLPLDTKANAKKFIDLAHPELVLFIKYEVWPNYLKVLKDRNIKTLLISATFRKNQIYFKPYGGLMRNSLRTFDHIFVQNAASKDVLSRINIETVTVSGDTRFDRVSNQLEIDNTVPSITEFIDNKLCVVVGSSWPEDDVLLIQYINSLKDDTTKFIIAPHNIKDKQITQFQEQLNEASIRYSNIDNQQLTNYKILIIDSIGLLSKLYSYATIAYVGGAMGKTGLHNILEPAVFGVPIIIGQNFDKFPEAQKLSEKGGLFSVKNHVALAKISSKLLKDEQFRLKKGAINRVFVKENKGTIIQIMSYIRK